MDERTSLTSNAKKTFQIPDKFLCPISRQIMEEPVVASDGYTYEKEEIERWMRATAVPRSPLADQVLLDKAFPLKLNQYVKSDIAAFVSEHRTQIDPADFYLPASWKAALIKSISSGNAVQFESCLNKDARLKPALIEGTKTTLALVCEKGTPAMIKILLTALGVDAVRQQLCSTDLPLLSNPLYLAWQSNPHGFISVKTILDQLTLRPTDICFLWSNVAIKKPHYLNALFLEICQKGTLEEMDVLLKAGAQLNATTPDGRTGLFYACEAQNINKIEGLRQRGATLNARDKKGQTLLHIAAQLKWMDGCLYLMEKGLSVDEKDHAGNTVLMACVNAYDSNFSVLLKTVLHNSLEGDCGNGTRRRAIKMLGALNYPSPEVIHTLLTVLGEPHLRLYSDPERAAAARAMGQLGDGSADSVRALNHALKHPTESVRRAAAQGLLELGQEMRESVKVLMDMNPKVYSHQEFQERAESIRALGQWGHPTPEILSTVIRTLEQSGAAPWLPHEVIELCMTRWQHLPNVYEALLKAISAGDQRVITEVGKHIADWDGDNTQLINVLIKKAASDKDVLTRRAAILALGNVKQPSLEIGRLMVKLLKDTNETLLIYSLIEVLGQLKQATPEIIEALQVFLRNTKNSYPCVLAAKSLWSLGQETPEIRLILCQLLSDTQWNVRQLATKMWSQLKGDEAEIKAVLVERLADQDAQVRQAAIEALVLRQWISEDVYLALQKCKVDTDVRVCVTAVWALVLFGEKTTEHVQIALKGLKGSDKQTRQLVALTLKECYTVLTLEDMTVLWEGLSDSEAEVRETILQICEKCADLLQKPACALTDTRLLTTLLERSQAGIAATDKYGNNLLIHAIFHQHIEMVQWLLQQGISATQKNALGYSALHCAVLARHPAILQRLLTHLPLSAIDSKNTAGETALILAAKQGHMDLMVLLLEAGANECVVDKQQQSVSQILVKHDHEAWVATFNEKVHTIRCDRLMENRALRTEVNTLKQQMNLLQAQLANVLDPIQKRSTGNNDSLSTGVPQSTSISSVVYPPIFAPAERQPPTQVLIKAPEISQQPGLDHF